MKRRFMTAALAGLIVAVSGCAPVDEAQTTAYFESTAQDMTTQEQTTQEITVPEETTAAQKEASWDVTGDEVWFSAPSGFYGKSLSVAMTTNETEGEIHYTTDGSTPTAASPLYTSEIVIDAGRNEFPPCVCIRAVVIDSSGKAGEESVHVYFVDTGIGDRFDTYVFTVFGDYEDVYGDTGFLNPENSHNRGMESERKVYVAAFTPEGEQVLGQFCGARVYGGASRDASLKSIKLFARKTYDADKGSFTANLFDTPGYDGKSISKYKKLVLRNAGNDFQFAYLRDELSHTLALQAGFADYEAVRPVVGYVNGAYYCFYWLHENYCDDYFKARYGKAAGEFVVLEGNDRKKYDPNMQEDEQQFYDEYNSMYDSFKDADLTDDEEYERLCSVLDVENYLDYFAFNIYICNADWPENNMKVYRYYPAKGEEPGEGVFDGRWRHLLHDMDYTYGMYDQSKVMANNDNLAIILKKGNNKYSPLFAGLMQREDCKLYFANKMAQLMSTTLSHKNILQTLDDVDALRSAEMVHYYKYLANLRNKGDDSIWTRSNHLENYMQQIRSFSLMRPVYIIRYIEKDLGVTIVENDGVYTVAQNTGEE